jgi:DNA-3-methyladenine glycosylase
MSMPALLAPEFFARPAERVASDLIGQMLVRRSGHDLVRGRIVETEAYVGAHDLACHAAKGRTPRTEVMFGPAGVLYVYFVYGIHWMLNVVTGQVGHPEAVLIRGLDTVSGPARLTRALAIDRDLNGRPATPESGLWFEEGPPLVPGERIERTPRIGVDYAGPIWAPAELRFLLISKEDGPGRRRPGPKATISSPRSNKTGQRRRCS